MKTGVIIAVFGSIWSAALGAIGYAAYLRWFVISSDPFDPMRIVSVDALWIACLLFLASVPVATLARSIKV